MCLQPQITKAPSGVGLSSVPCGHCLECLQQYQQDWTCRISEEVKAWDSCIFFTLTYGSDSVPYLVDGTLLVRSSGLSDLKLSGLDLFVYNRPLSEDTRSFRIDRKVFLDNYLDSGSSSSVAVQTVLYDDVREWLKYCRKWYDRHVSSVDFRGLSVSPSLKDLSYIDLDGVSRLYPKSAYSKSFKYFITSEYGPRTLRPHYHGVIFGVSEDIFRNVFAKWWIDHFGDGSLRSVKFSKYDCSKGGALYIAKYCSKGSFEHPLCSRIQHFKSGRCFNHRSFYKCLEYFGLDVPYCNPTFHLISKGIGIRYAFRPAVQDYWKCVCDDSDGFVCRGKKLLSLSLDSFSQLCSRQSLACKPLQDSANNWFVDLVSFDSRPHRVLGHDLVFVVDTKSDDFLEFAYSIHSLKYIRNYVHQGKTQAFFSRLPRYYRRFLLSPSARLANDFISVRLHELDFNRKQKQIESCGCADSSSALVREFSRRENVVNEVRRKGFESKFMRFYDRVFPGDCL